MKGNHILVHVEEAMKVCNPAQVQEALDLAKNIADPAMANAQQCWTMIWDKPLYAYTKTDIGDVYRQRLASHVEGQRWRQWADSSSPFLTLDGPANRNSSFEFTPVCPVAVRETGIAKSRLFAVQGGARALAHLAERSETPFAPLIQSSSEMLLVKLKEMLGPRWGHITILHLLTDFGLASKPDRWVVRSMHRLGLVPTVKQRDVPSAKDAILIDRLIKDLVHEHDGELRPQRLRYFEKLLMEYSKQGVCSDADVKTKAAA